MDMEAGQGEHAVYKIIPNSKDFDTLQPGSHYVGVDAVTWYINKEDNWFTKRMASGTLEITLASGLEKYQTALGTFDLKGGSKTAPVFDKPVLLDRNYRGGNIGFNASLTAIKKDTVLASILKSAADASLGIVAGMVDTATVAGPTQLLTTAGGELVKGVRDILSDKTDKHEPLFDFSGLQTTIQATDVVGPEIYLLFHRGSKLEQKKITVETSGQATIPLYDNKSINDGAWLLLRIKRSSEYPNVREWFVSRRKLKAELKKLVDDVVNGFQPKDKALEQFVFTQIGDRTILDQFGNLRSIILNDGVITEIQALAFVTELTSAVVTAKKAIEKVDNNIFAKGVDSIKKMINAGNMDKAVEAILNDEVASVLGSRENTIVGNILPNLSSRNLLDQLKHMPITQKEFLV